VNTPANRVRTLSAGKIFALAFVALFCYLDWITHRSAVAVVVIAAGGIAVIVFGREIATKLNLQDEIAKIPARAKPILFAAPGLLYFMSRGSGTSGAGGPVFFASAIAVAAPALFGPEIDARLAGFYAARNKAAPRVLRMIAAPILAVLLSFLIIHGSLGDIGALFGGTTKAARTPAGLGGRFFLAALLSASVSFLLLREARR